MKFLLEIFVQNSPIYKYKKISFRIFVVKCYEDFLEWSIHLPYEMKKPMLNKFEDFPMLNKFEEIQIEET